MTVKIIPWWLYWSAIASWVLYMVFSPLIPKGVWFDVVSRVVILATFLFLFCNPSERKVKEIVTDEN